MSTKTRRSYTETFKEEAVRLVRESGQPVTHVARDLGIADHLALPLAGRAAARGGAGPDTSIGTGRTGGTRPAST